MEQPDAGLDSWITTGDLDELLREIDRRCDRGDWDGLVTLRDRARSADERGHQLWPAASFAEYRMALSAPAPWAAVAVRGGGYLAAGPLTEVVAQHHTWSELEPELGGGPTRDHVAQERVLRGEDLGVSPIGELPGRLLAWEPAYALAEYHADGTARFPAPAPITMTERVRGERRAPAPDAVDGTTALEDVARHWVTHSEGRVRAAGVEGTAADAVATVHDGAVRWAQVSPADAVALLAWSAASGGARGRRRGAATGRFEAWWALAVLTAQDDDWPVDPGPAAEELRWWVWTPDEVPVGWICRLAVEDPVDGLAWALDASDHPPIPASNGFVARMER